MRVDGAQNSHIAFFVPNLIGGGAERMMVRLAAAFASQGDSADLVLATAAGPYLDEVPDTVRLVDLEAGGVMAALPALVRYLRTERPHAVISALAHANVIIVIAIALARVPTRIILQQATTPSSVHLSGLALKRRVVHSMVNLAYRRADAVVAVSSGVYSDLVHRLGVPQHVAHVIYNPVVHPELAEQAAAPLDDPWFAPGAAPVVLSVGRLSVEKDYPSLIRAFAMVRRSRDARLLILGEGVERQRLETLVADLGIAESVRLHGFDTNPYRYMSRADAYVLSSQREGLPGALIEAMAAGCPVISTDCPSGPAEILANGEFGSLVPVGDVERLAEAILRVLQDPPETGHAIERSRDFSTASSLRAYTRLITAHASAVRHAAAS